MRIEHEKTQEVHGSSIRQTEKGTKIGTISGDSKATTDAIVTRVTIENLTRTGKTTVARTTTTATTTTGEETTTAPSDGTVVMGAEPEVGNTGDKEAGQEHTTRARPRDDPTTTTPTTVRERNNGTTQSFTEKTGTRKTETSTGNERTVDSFNKTRRRGTTGTETDSEVTTTTTEITTTGTTNTTPAESHTI